MAMASYDAGTLVSISASFTNTSGFATDPGTVTAAVLKPDGTTVTYSLAGATVVRDSTGNYHAIVDTTAGPQGVWSYEFTGTPPLKVVSDGQFYVKVLGF